MMRDQKLWTWHILAGGVILVLLGLHMTVMHLDKVVHLAGYNPAGGHPVDWANVVARGKSAFTAVSYVLLLGAALFHGLYGLRNIVFELNPSAGAKKAIGALLALGGVALFAFGTWAALASHTAAMAQ
jgi:succinate dehydrogenase hydrophobic anchor subunit